ncbi:MAG: DUF2628 domain-containing protein [Desulfovibrio sp.]
MRFFKKVDSKDVDGWNDVESENYRLLELFVGPNHEAYIHPEESQKGGAFNFAAAFVPFSWFLYRRLYLVGFIVLVVLAILEKLLPTGVSLGAFGPLGIMANELYVGHAKRKIKKFQKQDLSQEALENKIKGAGGTFPLGGFAGALVVSVILMATFLPIPPPSCTDSGVRQVVERIATKDMIKKNKNPELLNISEYQPVDDVYSYGVKYCSCMWDYDGSVKKVYFATTWIDSDVKRFYVQTAYDLAWLIKKVAKNKADRELVQKNN